MENAEITQRFFLSLLDEQLSGMVKYLLLSFFTISTLSANSSLLQEDELQKVYSLTKSNLDSAYSLSYELLKDCRVNDDYFGLVKLNYLLGFLHKKDDNIGKSVLHYLEAIRYSEKASYEEVRKDAIDIHQNLANLYRIYKANELAIKYYKEGIEIADYIDDQKKVVSLKFNLALTYEQNGQNDEAIYLFNQIINVSTEDRKQRILNELGLIHWQIGDLESAKMYFSQLLDLDEEFKIYTAKALHNLGEIEHEVGNPDKAIELINQSIRLKEVITDVDQRSLFISHKVLGDYLFEKSEFNSALHSYKMAESLIHSVENESIAFELYRSLSQLNYELGNQAEARAYNNLHAQNINNYLDSQQNLLETDRQYNMDLITQRYIDEVNKQERIASILFYSKLISGSLLTLLLFTVGFNWYQKVQLRKSIVRDLINLKVID